MWIPKDIEIKNLMTHIDTKYEFQQNIVTLFQGLNLDDDEQESNGAGKSVLIEAVSYAILGSGLKKTVDADLIRNGEKSAYIRFELENSRNNSLLVIEREINLRTTSKLNIWLNGIDQKDKFATIPDGNKLILDLIGISRKDLLNYYIISKEKYISFYSSSDNDKKEVIARFSKSDSIDGIDKLIKAKLNEFDVEFKEFNDQIVSIDATIKVYNDQIEEEKNTDKEKLKSEQILQYQDQIVKNDYEIFDKKHNIEWLEDANIILNNQVKRYEKIIGEYNRQVELLKKVDYTKELGAIDFKEAKIKKEETAKKAEKTSLETELEESKQTLRDLETGLRGLITCPKCTHEFIPDEEFDVEDARESKPIYEEGINLLQEGINDLKLVLNGFKAKYDALDKEREVYRKKVKEFNNQKAVIDLKIQRCRNNIKSINDPIKGLLKNYQTSITTYNTAIENLKANNVKIQTLIDDLKNQKIEDEIAKIQTKIKELDVQRREIEEQIGLKETEKFKHEQWIYNFEKKFKSYLANKSVKSIEGLSNLMLKKMNSNLQVQLEGYGLLKNGDLREKITPYVLRDGFNEGSFFKFSGGEKGRLEIATITGIQQLINMNSNSGGLDLLYVDEILEGVDGRGIQSIAKSAKKLNKTICLITHVNIPVETDYNVVTIEKRNKISKII